LPQTLKTIFLFLVMAAVITIASCSGCSEGKGKKASYVQPSVDYRGRYRKGHIRKPVNTRKDAIKSRSRSRYYYHTRGKYRRKAKKD
jgi:hypothetical protein